MNKQPINLILNDNNINEKENEKIEKEEKIEKINQVWAEHWPKAGVNF